MFLEEYETAKKRGAKIYAEVTGFGFCGDATSLLVPHPEGAGIRRAMENSLKESQIAPEEIDVINTHSPSTPAGDLSDYRAILRVFE